MGEVTVGDLTEGSWVEVRCRTPWSDKAVTVVGWLRAVLPYGDNNHYLVVEQREGGELPLALLLSRIQTIYTRVEVKRIFRRPEDLFEELHDKLGETK